MQLRNTMMMFLAGLLASVLAGCGGGDGANVRPDMPKPPPQSESPTVNYDALATEHLSTARFTTHQPRVLEQVGAHHAYARGLTGSGVRIGIEDTVVDYTQRGEFGSRVKTGNADGAVLAYWRPLGDFLAEEYDCTAPNPHCDGITTTVDAGNDPEAINAAVRDSVDDVGWPPYDDQDFVKDTSKDRALRHVAVVGNPDPVWRHRTPRNRSRINRGRQHGRSSPGSHDHRSGERSRRKSG